MVVAVRGNRGAVERSGVFMERRKDAGEGKRYRLARPRSVALVSFHCYFSFLLVFPFIEAHHGRFLPFPSLLFSLVGVHVYSYRSFIGM